VVLVVLVVLVQLQQQVVRAVYRHRPAQRAAIALSARY